jgi:hypothetical protein
MYDVASSLKVKYEKVYRRKFHNMEIIFTVGILLVLKLGHVS